MNKAQVQDVVAQKLDVSKAEAQRIISVVVGTIVEGAKEDGEAIIAGLGKLKVVETKATSGVAMGKAWSKPAGKAFKLSVSKEGKELL